MKISQVIALGFAVCSFSAIAADKQIDFTSFDTDGDGYISFNESTKETKLMRSFKELDADKDDRISREEFSQFNKAKQ